MIQLLPPRGDLLDLGCGGGHLLARYGPPGGRRIGLDVSLESCRRTRMALRGRHDGAGIVLASADLGLPFPAASFDTVAAVSVLQMVVDPVACLTDIKRVLRPGGQLVLEVPNLAFLPRRLALLAGHHPRSSFGSGWDGGTLHGFTRGALLHLLEITGFRVESMSGSGVFAPVRRFWLSLLSGDLIVLARPVDGRG